MIGIVFLLPGKPLYEVLTSNIIFAIFNLRSYNSDIMNKIKESLMLRLILLLLVGFIPASVMLYAERTMKRTYLALFLKGLASLVFVVIGLIAKKSCQDTHYGTYVLVGLIFGFFGDILLSLKLPNFNNDLFFYIGGTAFLLGHVFYLITLSPKTGPFWLPAVISGLLFGSIWTLISYRKGVSDRPFIYRLCSFIYLCVVSTVMAFGVTMCIREGVSKGAVIAMLGFIGFGISDYVLMHSLARDRYPFTAALLVMIFYWGGQNLIAQSMFYM